MNRQWKLMLASALGLLISTAALNARPPSGGHSGGHAPRPSHPAPMHAPSGNHQQPFASSHHPSPNGSGMHPTMSASHSGTGNHAFGASAAKHPAANHPVNQHVAKPNQSKPSGNGQAAKPKAPGANGIGQVANAKGGTPSVQRPQLPKPPAKQQSALKTGKSKAAGKQLNGSNKQTVKQLKSQPGGPAATSQGIGQVFQSVFGSEFQALGLGIGLAFETIGMGLAPAFESIAQAFGAAFSAFP